MDLPSTRTPIQLTHHGQVVYFPFLLLPSLNIDEIQSNTETSSFSSRQLKKLGAHHQKRQKCHCWIMNKGRKGLKRLCFSLRKIITPVHVSKKYYSYYIAPVNILHFFFYSYSYSAFVRKQLNNKVLFLILHVLTSVKYSQLLFLGGKIK